MKKKIVKAIKCKNYDKHMLGLGEGAAPLFIRESHAIEEGWAKQNGKWLCPDCVREAGNWALRGDMV